MIRQPVSSSHIRAIGHDPHTNQLEVEFHDGKVWRYDEVNVDEFNNLLRAKSVGNHFHTFIRKVKMGNEVEP